MSYKYFGRLAGGSNAGDSLGETASGNTTTPFRPQSPATKFMAYGEDASSLNINRALSALSANSDYLSSILDTPALRKDVLTPLRDNGVGGTQSGFSSLSGKSFGASGFNLGLGSSPVVWVYVGLHRDSLHKTLRAYRVKTGEYIDGPYPDISEMDKVLIEDVRTHSGAATSYFDGQGPYVGTPELSLADKIPGITLVETGITPYSGNPESVNIASWDEDGPKIGDVGTPLSWGDLYARPGCFVLVSGETGVTTNNGLYRIVSISGTTPGSGATSGGDKAVLTRGGLHKVTVDNAASFDVGRRVTWRSAPNHNAVSTKNQRENSAYVMYKIGNDLYLSTFSSPEDFAIQGTGVAYRVTDAAASHGPVHNTGSVGLVDQEEGSSQNWSMPSGTLLYNNSTGASATVTAILPAGYPVKFATNSNPGNVQLCAPPGFLLNPMLDVTSTAIMGGDYYVHCHTLTTVEERLRSPGQSANRFTYDNSSDRLFFTEGDENRYKAFAKFLRIGYEPSGSPKVRPASYDATKRILGDSVWKVSIDTEAGTKDITLAGLTVGQTINWKHPSFSNIAGSLTTSKLVAFGVEGGDHYLILKDVENSGWDVADFHVTNEPLTTGGSPSASFMTADPGGVTDYHILDVTYGPYLKDSTPAEYVPSFGLNAAYHNHYDASANARGTRGLGSTIATVDGKPLTVILPEASPNEGLVVRTVDPDPVPGYDLITLKKRDGTDIATVGYASSSITFDDANTPSAIPFSDANHTTLPTQHGAIEQSVLGALEGSLQGGSDFSAVSSGVLHFGGVSVVGFDMDLGVTYFHFRGAKLKVAATTVAANPLIGDGILFYNTSTSAYLIEDIATFDMGDQAKIAVARVAVDALGVSKFIYCGYSINRLDQRTDIFVGVTNSDLSELYTNNVAHFLTLGEALKAIEAWDTADETPERGYTITVVGDTTEQTDALKDIALPLTVPPNQQITIRGSSNKVSDVLVGTNKNSVVSWSESAYLLNLNQTRGVIIENLSTQWTGALAASSTAVPAVAPYYSLGTLGAGSTEHVTIRNCQHVGGEAFVVMPSVQALDVVIEGCHSLAAGCGLHFDRASLLSDSRLTVRNCVFEMQAVAPAFLRNEGQYASAVYIGSASGVFDHVSIKDCKAQASGTDGFHRGVHLHTPGESVLISDNLFEYIGDSVANQASTTNGGIRIENSGANPEDRLITIRGNSFANLSTRTGVYLNSAGTAQITGNSFSAHSSVNLKGGDFTIETTALAEGAQINNNTLEGTHGFALKLGAEGVRAFGNLIKGKGDDGSGALVQVTANKTAFESNRVTLSDAAATCSLAISVATTLSHVSINGNSITNTRTSTGSATFDVELGNVSSHFTFNNNTLVGEDGGDLKTAIQAGGTHDKWNVRGNTLEGDIQVRLLTSSRIEGNTFEKLEMDTTGGADVSSGVVIQGNVLEGIDADNGSHVLEEGVVANNILTTDFGIRLNQGNALTQGKGNTVSGNNFINSAGPIRTNYGSTVTANINVNEIDAGTVSTSTVPSTITGNQGASGGLLVITSYGGSTITNNVNVATVMAGSETVVSNNLFTAAPSLINIDGGNCTVSGNRQTNSSGALTISLGDASTSANDCSVSGNFTEGGDIEVAGNTCSIFNNNLGFIDALGGGVGSIRVGAFAGAVSSGGKNCTVTGNVLPGGTIYLVRGQNILVGNILIYTEDDGSGANDSIMGAHITSAGGASGAIIIDAGAQFSPGGTLGSFHNNVFIGNMYRGGGAAPDFGPAVTIAVGAGSSRPFEGGDGDLENGEDLCHIHDGGVQRRLNLEE